MSDLLNRITVDPKICGGKPIVRGTRVGVAVILDSLAEGLTPEQIVGELPTLTVEDVHAAIAWAARLVREENEVPLRSGSE